MAKQHIHSKNSKLGYLDWTHKTNGQTRHMAKQHVHQKDSRLPFLEWTHRTNGHTKKIFIQRILHLYE